MDASTAQPMIDEVNDAVTQVESLAASSSDQDAKSAASMLRRAADDWSGPQLAQTQVGTRTDENWTAYGTDESDSGSLLSQAKREVRDFGSIFVQWRKGMEDVGEDTAAAVNYTTARLAEWRLALDGYKAALVSCDQRELDAEAIANALVNQQSKLSANARDLLFGASASLAAVKLGAAHDAVAAAEKLLSAMESAAQAEGGILVTFPSLQIPGAPQPGPLQEDTGFHFGPSDGGTPTARADDESGGQSIDPSVQGLGNPFVVAGISVAVFLAGMATIGALISWLLAYYQHLGQVTQDNEINKLLDISGDPTKTPEERRAAAKAAENLSKHPPPDPMSGLAHLADEGISLVKAAVGTGLAAGAAYLVWDNWDAIRDGAKAAWARITGKRTTNPKRRRKNPRKRRRAYA